MILLLAACMLVACGSRYMVFPRGTVYDLRENRILFGGTKGAIVSDYFLSPNRVFSYQDENYRIERENEWSDQYTLFEGNENLGTMTIDLEKDDEKHIYNMCDFVYDEKENKAQILFVTQVSFDYTNMLLYDGFNVITIDIISSAIESNIRYEYPPNITDGLEWFTEICFLNHSNPRLSKDYIYYDGFTYLCRVNLETGEYEVLTQINALIEGYLRECGDISEIDIKVYTVVYIDETDDYFLVAFSHGENFEEGKGGKAVLDPDFQKLYCVTLRTD